MFQAVLIDDELALGALAGGWGAGDHDLLRARGDGDDGAAGGGRGDRARVERPALLSAGELRGGDGECGGGHRLRLGVCADWMGIAKIGMDEENFLLAMAAGQRVSAKTNRDDELHFSSSTVPPHFTRRSLP